MSDGELQATVPVVEQTPGAVEASPSAPTTPLTEVLAQKLGEFEQRIATLESTVQPPDVPSLLSRLETTDNRLARLELAAQPAAPLSDGLIQHIATLAFQQMEEYLQTQLGIGKQPLRG